MFTRLDNYQLDAIESTFARRAADKRRQVIDLSIGVYRDASGNAPIMECVQRAERKVVELQATKAYISPAGNEAYCRAIERLIVGDNRQPFCEQHLISLQTPGAGAALRMAAECVKSFTPEAVVWFSSPIWDHQPDFFSATGLVVKQYDYYDQQDNCLVFPAMLTSLEQAAPNDIVVLHGSCHNPTGEDLSPEQWTELAVFMRERQLIPLIDIAYQGYGDGIDEDVVGVNRVLEHVPHAMVVVSSSKSFAVYRDRAGAFILKHSEAPALRDKLEMHLVDLARALYFMPPDHGAEVIQTILNDVQLSALWRAELNAAREQIVALRSQTYTALQAAMPRRDFSFLLRQKGMFSCLPLSEASRLQLEQDHGVYLMPGGRINFAALSSQKLSQLAAVLPAYL